MTDDERRAAPRHLACFPAEIDAGQEWATTALIRDLSATGALLLAREAFVVGEPLTVQLHLSDELGPRHATARVLRVEPNRAEGERVWPVAVAIHFEEPLDDVEKEIEELAQRQADTNWPSYR